MIEIEYNHMTVVGIVAMRSNEVTHISCAKKNHACDWCGESIPKGSSYLRWTNFGDEVCTVKVHTECHTALLEAADLEHGYLEFSPGEQPRGGIS